MEKIINIFKALSDKTRLRILFILQQAKKELCICEIVDSLKLPQYNISRQIKELKQAGLVIERREGKFIFYKTAKPDSKVQAQVCAAVMAFDRAFFMRDLENLKNRLELRVKGKCVVGSKKVKVLSVFLAAAFAANIIFPAFAQEQKPQSKVVAYYFHGSFRCPTCRKLEQYSKEAIEENFKDAIASGSLVFTAVNVEDSGNEHYAADYKLYTKSLILSLVKDGKEREWKNLDKIWEYVGNKDRFLAYVKDGVASMLAEAE